MRGWYFRFVFTLTLFFTRSASAQLGELRLASTGAEYQAPVTYRGHRMDFQVYRAGLMVPFTVKEKTTFLLTSFNYQLIHVQQSGTVSGSGDLHLMTMSPVLVHRFSERIMGIVQTGYGIASDLGAPVTGRDFYFTGTAIGLYKLNDALTLGAGVSYDQRTGNILPVPLGALYWEPRPRFSIRGVIPSAVYVSFRPWPPLTLQLMGSFEGQRYHVANDAAGGDHKTQLAYSVVKAGAGARIHFNKWVHLEANAGALLLRRFELFVDDHSRGDDTIPAGPFVGANLWFGSSGWNEGKGAR